MRRSLSGLIGIGLTLLISSCVLESTESDEVSQIVNVDIEDIGFSNGSTYNFGMVESDKGSKTVSVTFENTGTADITVSGIEVSDAANYSLTAPALPLTAPAGTSASAGIVFTPKASGTLTAQLTITLTGGGAPFLLNLTGKGNYRPAAKFGIDVTGAENSAANGFYVRNGFVNTGSERRPLYVKNGTPNYYSYLYDASDSYFWGIDSSATIGYPESPEYFYEEWAYYPMVPPAADWKDGETGDPVSLALTRRDITGTEGLAGQELAANYSYYDQDGDAQDTGGTAFQWYRSETEEGTYTAITGAVNSTYTPSAGDVNMYIKVEITPSAQTGLTAGTPTMSSPTIQISSPPA